MARGKRAASSTEARAAAGVPLAYRLEGGSEVVTMLARRLGVPATLDAVSVAVADPSSVQRRLHALPVLGLLLLETLVDLGGASSADALEADVCARSGLASVPFDLILGAVLDASTLVVTTSRGLGLRTLTLLEACAGRVAAHLRGLSLPRGAPPEAARGGPSQDARDLLALAGLTAHRQLRMTMSGHPNRGSLKGFLKGLGVEPARAERLLQEARHHRMLVGSDGPARLRLQAVSAAMEGQDALGAALLAGLPRARWVPLESLVRARGAQPNIEARRGGQWYVQHRASDPRVRRELLASPGLEVLEHGGGTWVRPHRLDAGPSLGDGHVTPNFDVILGPHTSAALVAEVGLGCELVRVDRMLTFRLGPRTVEGGLSVGMEGARFLDALGRVGPHGLPDNVRTMVQDWLQSARLVRLDAATLLRVPPRHEAAVLAALGSELLGKLGPGSLVVRPGASPRALAERLGKLGYRVSSERDLTARSASQTRRARPSWDDDDLDETDEDPGGLEAFGGSLTYEPGMPASPLELDLWLSAEPDPELAKRFEAARADLFVRDLASLAPPGVAEKSASPRSVAARATPASPAVRPPAGQPAGLARRGVAPAPAGRSVPDTTDPAEIKGCIERALDEDREVVLWLRASGGVLEETVTVQAIRSLGALTVILVVNPLTDEGRAIRLDQLTGASLAPRGGG